MIEWTYRLLKNMTVNEVYEMWCLREEVFVVEQNCPYQDADGLDWQAVHVLGYENGILIAYARILYLPTSVNCFGRLLVRKTHRGHGIASHLLKNVLAYIAKYPNHTQAIAISAQTYLVNFYQSFGFACKGDEYLEDNIPHIKMVRNVSDEFVFSVADTQQVDEPEI